MNTGKRETDRKWLLFLCLAAFATNLPRLILGPYSAVGILGDIGDYSVPYLMAADNGLFLDQWIGEAPMGASLFALGYYAPAQQFFYSIFPGWMAHGINWLLLTLVSAFATYFAARRILHVDALAATFSGLLGAVAIANGNFGYSVIALIPLVLLSTFLFCNRPNWRTGALIVISSAALAVWTPAKFLVLFPAIVILVGTLCLAENSVRNRIAAAMIAIVTIYVLRAGDLADMIAATARSDRHWSVMQNAVGPLFLRGLEYSFEYLDPRILLKVAPLPHTNPTTVGFLFCLIAILFRIKDRVFRKLMAAIMALAFLQVIFPPVWQWVLFNIAGHPGVYFHPKLWRPAIPLLFLGAGIGVAGLTAYLTPIMAARWKARTVRLASLIPIALLLTVGLVSSLGFGVRSWIADGSYHSLYRDPDIRSLKVRMADDPAIPRAAMVNQPNAILAAYGVPTPFGRRDWLSRRHALLLKNAGLMNPAPAGSVDYTALYSQRLSLKESNFPGRVNSDPVLALLALTSIKYIVARGVLERSYLTPYGPAPAVKWKTLSVSEKVKASVSTNFGGPSPVSVYRFEHALPRVRPVTKLVTAVDAETAARTILSQPLTKLSGMAVVEGHAAISHSLGLPDQLRVTYDDKSGYAIDVSSPTSALLVVSEIDDGGWVFKVDGITADAVSVNAAFIGLPVPAGHHRLTLRRASS